MCVKFMCIIGGYNIIGVHNDSVWESVYVSYFAASNSSVIIVRHVLNGLLVQ